MDTQLQDGCCSSRCLLPFADQDLAGEGVGLGPRSSASSDISNTRLQKYQQESVHQEEAEMFLVDLSGLDWQGECKGGHLPSVKHSSKPHLESGCSRRQQAGSFAISQVRSDDVTSAEPGAAGRASPRPAVAPTARLPEGHEAASRTHQHTGW